MLKTLKSEIINIRLTDINIIDWLRFKIKFINVQIPIKRIKILEGLVNMLNIKKLNNRNVDLLFNLINSRIPKNKKVRKSRSVQFVIAHLRKLIDVNRRATNPIT